MRKPRKKQKKLVRVKNPKSAVQRSLDMMVIGWMAQKAKQSVKRTDDQAAESAFLSDVAESEYSEYFPWLEPKMGRKGAGR